MASKNVVCLEQKRLDVHFEPVFEQCMKLAERTAVYLDGPGRPNAKLNDHEAARVYIRESFMLTTALLDCSGWLLSWRAYLGGEVEKELMIKRTKKILFESYRPRIDLTFPSDFIKLIKETQLLHAVCMRFRTTALLRLSA